MLFRYWEDKVYKNFKPGPPADYNFVSLHSLSLCCV